MNKTIYTQQENLNLSHTPRLLSVRQFSLEHKAFTEASLRFMMFNENTNGFKRAFLRIGRKRLIDEDMFFECARNPKNDADNLGGGK
jgi:hypothetical protein